MTLLNRLIQLLTNPRLAVERYFLPLVIIERYLLSFRKFVLCELDLNEDPRKKATTQIGVRQARLDDLEKLAKMRSSEERFGKNRVDKPRYALLLQERLKSGHQCFIAEGADMVLGYVWIAFLEFHVSEMKRKITLKNDEAMLYDVYTSSFYRGKEIFPRIAEVAFDSLRKNHYEKIYFITRKCNKPMINAGKKLNAKMVEALTFIGILMFTRLTRVSLRHDFGNAGAHERERIRWNKTQ